jgi:hypothetical protein
MHTYVYRSHCSVDYDDGPHFNDLPEMDMTVRMVPQRAARERRQERWIHDVCICVYTYLCITYIYKYMYFCIYIPVYVYIYICVHIEHEEIGRESKI